MRALWFGCSFLALGCADLVGAGFDQAHRAPTAAASGGAAATTGAVGAALGGTAGAMSNGADEGGGAGVAGQDLGLPHEVSVSLPPNPMDPAGSGAGKVTSPDGSIDCGAQCRASYQGSGIELVASAASGSAFHSWVSDPPGACSGDASSSSCSVSPGVGDAQRIEAYFVSGGTNLWATQFGGSGNENAQMLAFDAAGNLYVSGLFEAPNEIDPGLLEETVFIAKYDGLGHLQNSLKFGSTSDLRAKEVLAASATGEVVVSGDFDTWMSLPPVGSASYDGFGFDSYVAELNADFSPRWLRAVNGRGNQSAGPLALSPLDGSVYASFTFDGTIDTLGDPQSPLSSAGSTDIALARFFPDGSVAWKTSFGDDGVQVMGDRGLALAVAEDGHSVVLLTGEFSTRPADSTLSFNTQGGSCAPLFTTSSFQNAFLVGLDENGACLFAQEYGNDKGFSEGISLAPLPNGDLILGGAFTGELEFAPVEKFPDAYLAASDVDLEQSFIARLGPQGEWIPGRSFALAIREATGGTGRDAQLLRQLAVDQDGNVVAVVSFIGSAQIGAASYQARGQTSEPDILLVKLDQTGRLLYSHSFGTAQSDNVFGLACDANSACALAGTHGTNVSSAIDRLDFGGIASNPLPAPVGWDGVVAKFSP